MSKANGICRGGKDMSKMLGMQGSQTVAGTPNLGLKPKAKIGKPMASVLKPTTVKPR